MSSPSVGISIRSRSARREKLVLRSRVLGTAPGAAPCLLPALRTAEGCHCPSNSSKGKQLGQPAAYPRAGSHSGHGTLPFLGAQEPPWSRPGPGELSRAVPVRSAPLPAQLPQLHGLLLAPAGRDSLQPAPALCGEGRLSAACTVRGADFGIPLCSPLSGVSTACKEL